MQNIRSTRGQGILEYAAILVLVVFVIVVMLYVLGPAVTNLYSNIIYNF